MWYSAATFDKEREVSENDNILNSRKERYLLAIFVSQIKAFI